MTEYTKHALDFLEKAKATCNIEFGGCTYNPNWKEESFRNFYNVTLSTSRGSMRFKFWDSINNTEISKLTLEEYSKKRFNCQYRHLTYTEKARASKELKEKKCDAIPTTYDILACLTKYDPGTFEEFCAEFGYDEDIKTADRIYIAVSREYKQIERIFTAEQLEELQEIQ